MIRMIKLRPILILFFAITSMSSLYSDGARAESVSYTQDISTVPTDSGPQIPNDSSGLVIYPVGSLVNIYRSPFEGTSQFGAARYTSIEAGGSATYNFSPSNALSIFWGSPDSWNTLSIYSGLNGTGSLLYSITGGALSINGVGHDLVNFVDSTGLFASVVLTSTLNAFEFSNLVASDPMAATPLPSAFWQLLAGLGGVGLLAWHRKRRTAAMSARSPRGAQADNLNLIAG